MRILQFIFLFSSCLLASSYHDEIKVEGAKFRPSNLAIPSFQFSMQPTVVDTGFAEQLLQIIERDLEDSAVFKVLSRKSYLSDPQKEGFDRASIKFSNWRNIGAEGLAKGRITKKGDLYEVEIFTFPLDKTSSYKTKTYAVSPVQVKRLGHRIADDIYEFFSGEKGIFSTKIVATKEIGGISQLVLLNADGSNPKQLTFHQSVNLLPSFSNDGKSILFTNYSRNKPDLYEYSLEDSAIKLISKQKGINISGVVSPSGKEIAVTLSKDGNSEIYMLNRDGSIKKRLTHAWGIDATPSFSPDGKKIAFVSSRAGNPHIYVMNVDGSNVKRLTYKGRYNQTPKFSPDGKSIVFTARDEFKVFDIFLINLADGKISRITQVQGNNEDPSFSPNGRHVVFSSTRTGTKELFVSNLDGSSQRRLTTGGNYSTPYWGPII